MKHIVKGENIFKEDGTQTEDVQQLVQDKNYYDEILQAALLAGQIMMEAGSEMYRVEDTMNRIVKAASGEDSGVFSTPTGIFVGISGKSHVQYQPIDRRTINLEKISLVNEASRQFSTGKINLDELKRELTKINKETLEFPVWLQLLGAVVVSATLMILFSGKYQWSDLPVGALVGLVGYGLFLLIQKLTEIRFISEFIASIGLTSLAYLLVNTLSLGSDLDFIIIGGIMPLVPGVPLTNAFRDLLAGHLLSGGTRAIEALLSAVAIGAGVAVVIRFLIL